MGVFHPLEDVEFTEEFVRREYPDALRQWVTPDGAVLGAVFDFSSLLVPEGVTVRIKDLGFVLKRAALRRVAAVVVVERVAHQILLGLVSEELLSVRPIFPQWALRGCRYQRPQFKHQGGGGGGLGGCPDARPNNIGVIIGVATGGGGGGFIRILAAMPALTLGLLYARL